MLGKLVYALGLVTCVTGLQEKQTNDILVQSYEVYSGRSLLTPAASCVAVVLLLSVFLAWEFRPTLPTTVVADCAGDLEVTNTNTFDLQVND